MKLEKLRDKENDDYLRIEGESISFVELGGITFEEIREATS